MPWKDKERGRAWSREYTKRIHRDGTSWAKLHPVQVKAKRRQRTLKQYGLTPEQWDTLFAKQGHACAICRSPNPNGPNWATDHDHLTGKVRGILCSRCNTGIGQLQESHTLLRLAAEYLEAGK